MNRRAFVARVGAVLAAPLGAKAQQAERVYRIGALSELPRYDPTVERWRRAFARRGYVEGQNTIFEFRWGDGSGDTLRLRAAELVTLKLDIIMTTGHPASVAARKATATIPIVIMSADPLSDGLVATLGRPAGNVTGVFLPLADLAAKRVQLMKELVPDLRSVAIVSNPNSSTSRLQADSAESAARVLRITPHVVGLSSNSEAHVEKAFSAIVARGAKAVVVTQDAVTFQASRAIAQLTAKHRLPSSYAYREFAEAGGLMAYGTSLEENIDLAAFAADRVLKGAKPADIPMLQPTKTELIINLKTAKALGLTIPQSLLLRADQVIE